MAQAKRTALDHVRGHGQGQRTDPPRDVSEIWATCRGPKPRFEMTLDRRPFNKASRQDFSGQEQLLYTVLDNLLSNAEEASPEGQPLRLQCLRACWL